MACPGSIARLICLSRPGLPGFCAIGAGRPAEIGDSDGWTACVNRRQTASNSPNETRKPSSTI
jgi:hypothetical protein